MARRTKEGFKRRDLKDCAARLGRLAVFWRRAQSRNPPQSAGIFLCFAWLCFREPAASVEKVGEEREMAAAGAL